jgi:serine/threonine protein kinase
MSDTDSTESVLTKAFSLKEIQHIDSGGFKQVFRVKTSSGKDETLKVIALPAISDSESEKAYYSEAVGRAKREIAILGRCTSPELVKLGSIAAAEIEVLGTNSVVYSEEYLQGTDLWREIRGTSDFPTEHELKKCFASLLKAIRELWGLGFVHRDIKPLEFKLEVQRP